ncbi:MAG: hypothetical protein ACI35O_08460 [Bacillaceae bacterium]
METVTIKSEEVFNQLQKLVDNYLVTTEKMDEMTEVVLKQQKEGLAQLQNGFSLLFNQTKGAKEQWNQAFEQLAAKNPSLKDLLTQLQTLNQNVEQGIINTTQNSLDMLKNTHEKMTETLQLMLKMQKDNRLAAQSQLQSLFDFWNTSNQQFLSALKENAK